MTLIVFKFSAAIFFQIKIQFEQPDASAIAIACFLVKEGADLTLMNNKGKTAIDVCEDTSSRDIILYFKPNGVSAAKEASRIYRLNVVSTCPISKLYGHRQFFFKRAKNSKS